MKQIGHGEFNVEDLNLIDMEPDTCLPNEICQSKQSAYSKEKEGHEKSA